MEHSLTMKTKNFFAIIVGLNPYSNGTLSDYKKGSSLGTQDLS